MFANRFFMAQMSLQRNKRAELLLEIANEYLIFSLKNVKP